MKIGLKLWTRNASVLPEADKLIDGGIFDYIELYVVPNDPIEEFLSYDLEYIVHITSERFGFNISDPGNKEASTDILAKNMEISDDLNAEYMILHPGYGEIDTALEFLADQNDRRIAIENMPKIGINGESMVGYTKSQLEQLIDDKFNFCLDYGHAIKASISLKQEYRNYLQDLMELNPKIFHLSDGTFGIEHDEHLGFTAGEYSLDHMGDIVKRSNASHITLETPRNDLNSLVEDEDNRNIIVNYL